MSAGDGRPGGGDDRTDEDPALTGGRAGDGAVPAGPPGVPAADAGEANDETAATAKRTGRAAEDRGQEDRDPAGGGAVFEEHRDLLFSVAYRMLGSVTEAEDVVQEAWLRWHRADRSRVQDFRAYLAKLTARVAVDQLRRARAGREVYVGSWLPEPLATGPDVAEDAALADSVSMAMLVVLETLSPLERSVFVLREAFGFSHAEIADALDRSEESVRQIAHRARRHVQARRPRFESDRRLRREAAERFMAAAVGGDINALMALLAPGVTLWSDGGGKVRAPRRPVHGAEKVARFFAAISGDVPPGSAGRITEVNGGPAILVHAGDVPITVLTVDLDPDTHRIAALHLISNPDKLTGLTDGGRRGAGSRRDVRMPDR